MQEFLDPLGNLIDTFFVLVMAIVVPCTLITSVRIAIFGIKYLPPNKALSFFSRNEWCYSLMILLPIVIGEVARREISPLPWHAFNAAFARHGIINALYMVAVVITVELWVLWIPAHIYVEKRPSLQKEAEIFARCLNFAVGLLLLTPSNPIYYAIAFIVKNYNP